MNSHVKRLLKKGGYLQGKRNGKTVKLASAKQGGISVGAKHGPEGGIKGAVGTSARPIEFEGEEIIITAPAAADPTLHEFEGRKMTKRQILSAINQDAGGVSFADGGDVPGKIRALKGKSYKAGGKTMSSRQVVEYCGCGCAHTKEQKLAGGGSTQNETDYDRAIEMIKSVDTNKLRALEFLKTNPHAALRYIQEQVTGMNAGRTGVSWPPAYEDMIRSGYNKDLLLTSVRIIKDSEKNMIRRFWKGRIVDPELRAATAITEQKKYGGQIYTMTFDQFFREPRQGKFLEDLQTLPKTPKSEADTKADDEYHQAMDKLNAAGIGHVISNPSQAYYLKGNKKKIWEKFEKAEEKWMAHLQQSRSANQKIIYDKAVDQGMIIDPVTKAKGGTLDPKPRKTITIRIDNSPEDISNTALYKLGTQVKSFKQGGALFVKGGPAVPLSKQDLERSFLSFSKAPHYDGRNDQDEYLVLEWGKYGYGVSESQQAPDYDLIVDANRQFNKKWDGNYVGFAEFSDKFNTVTILSADQIAKDQHFYERLSNSKDTSIYKKVKKISGGNPVIDKRFAEDQKREKREQEMSKRLSEIIGQPVDPGTLAIFKYLKEGMAKVKNDVLYTLTLGRDYDSKKDFTAKELFAYLKKPEFIRSFYYEGTSISQADIRVAKNDQYRNYVASFELKWWRNSQELVFMGMTAKAPQDMQQFQEAYILLVNKCEKLFDAVMGESFAGGGGVNKYERHDDLYHAWRTRHLAYSKEKGWHNTGHYHGAVNNSSGLYITNKSADQLAEHANEAGITEDDLSGEQTFEYYKKENAGKFEAGGQTAGEYVADEFSWDNSDKTYPGWHDPKSRWNGFAIPYFDKKTTLEILKDSPDIQHRWEGETLFADFAPMEGYPTEYEEHEPTEITVAGKKINTYSVGGFGWTWMDNTKFGPPDQDSDEPKLAKGGAAKKTDPDKTDFTTSYTPVVTMPVRDEVTGKIKATSFIRLIKIIKPFVPEMQLKALTSLFNGEEQDGGWEIADRLAHIISNMPASYDTENVKSDDKIVYLHYFYGGSDWYIVEKDKGDSDDPIPGLQHQAFGYAILNQDYQSSEWGYISIEEIKSVRRIELDFYFTPVKFGELKKKWEGDDDKVQLAIDALSYYAHKSVGVHLSERQTREYRENEENNYHNENYLLLAETAGDPALINAATILINETNKQGGMSINGDLYNLKGKLLDIFNIHFDDVPKLSYTDNQGEKKSEPEYEFVGGNNNSLDVVKFADGSTANNWLSRLGLARFGYESKYITADFPSNVKVPAGFYALKANGSFLTKGVFESNLSSLQEEKNSEFHYGEKYGVHQHMVAQFQNELTSPDKGFEIIKETKHFFVIKKGGESGENEMLIVDNGGEFNLEDYKDRTFITSIGYSLSEVSDPKADSYLADPGYLANRVEEEFAEYFKGQQLEPETTPAETETPAPQIEEKSKPVVSSQASTMTLTQQASTNERIRQLVKEKGADRSKYSAEEISLLRLYEGAGSEKKTTTSVRILDQFFTPQDIIAKMWGIAFNHGFAFRQNIEILEPSVGSGRFLSYIPPNESGVYVRAYDVDEVCANICKILYPSFDIRHGSFESEFFKGKRHVGLAGVDRFYDLVIGNPPYRDYVSPYAPLGEKDATGATSFEMYFIGRGVDVLKTGGLLIYIIPNTFLSNNNKYNDFKEKLSRKADLIDAYRLPNGVFGNTDVGTDIIVLKKK